MATPPPPDLSIVIPAYNEEMRLSCTVHEVVGYCRTHRRCFELIIVDDGSRDATMSVARGLASQFEEIRVIGLPLNRGKGHAVRSGVADAKGRTVLFTDADRSTPIGELERLEAALASGADLAVGSRELPGDGVRARVKLYRRVIGRTFHQLVKLLAQVEVTDTQCGFKLFRASVAHDLFSRGLMDGFSFDVELLVIAKRRGFRIAEVPVNWTHQAGSKISLTRDSLHMAADLFRIRAHWLAGHYDWARASADAMLPLGEASIGIGASGA
jgi:dolichyl-phosphate beta-glucosyltransferase